jgi:hypothetical protein
MKAKENSDIMTEFNQWWREHGSVATQLMSETGKYIVLVPGKVDETYRKIAPGRREMKDAIVLCKWGMSKTSLVNDQLGSSQLIPTTEAIKAFIRAFPNESFMDRIQSGFKWLLQ